MGASEDLLLRLMQAGVPNAEYLTCMGDLEALKSIAARHNVELPISAAAASPQTAASADVAPQEPQEGFRKYSPAPKHYEEVRRQQQVEPRVRAPRWQVA